jgi:predicted RNase H-like nuclease
VQHGYPPRRKRYAFETFPHAIAWHLRGGNATAKRKRKQRRALLEANSFNVALLTNIDIADAALCALTAHLAAQDASLCVYGEGATGFIIVPEKAREG